MVNWLPYKGVLDRVAIAIEPPPIEPPPTAHRHRLLHDLPLRLDAIRQTPPSAVPSAARRAPPAHATPRVRSCFCGRHLPPRCDGGPASAGSRHSTGRSDGEEPLLAERGTATECGHEVDACPRNTARPLVLLRQASASTVRRRRGKCGVARSHCSRSAERPRCAATELACGHRVR
jgi:hypothetical protein